MANENHLELARQGREVWNAWREEHPDEKVDFSGANFTRSENRKISFAGFEFGDQANFNHTSFGNGPGANFRHPDITLANGKGSEGEAFFYKAKFGSAANFIGATFGDWAFFDAVEFLGSPCFDFSTFGGGAAFRGAKLGPFATFKCCRFGRAASFDEIVASGEASFEGALFEEVAYFRGARFGGTVSCASIGPVGARRQALHLKSINDGIDSLRSKLDPFEREGFATKLEKMDFSDAVFGDVASFRYRDLRGVLEFSNAVFGEPPDFTGSTNRESINLTGASFDFGTRSRRRAFTHWTTSSSIASDLRRLRGVAAEVHASDAERDLFILERLAERGVGWKQWWTKGGCQLLWGWWKPFGHSLLMSLYWVSSNYGRSVLLPSLWIIAANFFAFKWLYAWLLNKPLNDAALTNLTLASALPFGVLSADTRDKALRELVGTKLIEWDVHFLSIVQGATNVILLFLIGLALRNFFKTK